MIIKLVKIDYYKCVFCFSFQLLNYPRDWMSERANLTSWNKNQWTMARFEVLTAVKVRCQDTYNDSDGDRGIKDVFCYAYKIY